MRRIFLFRKQDENDTNKNINTIGGKLLLIDDNESNFNKFLLNASQLLDVNVKKVYLKFDDNFIEIDNLNQVQNNDAVYASVSLKLSQPLVTSTTSADDASKLDTEKTEITISDAIIKTSINEFNMLNDWITLNIGGKCFTTTRSTLTSREPDSMLARMFNADTMNCWKHKCSPNGAILIDRSFNYFEPIINYLRHGKLIIDNNLNIYGVLEEAKFYSMDNLIEIIEREIQIKETEQKLIKNPPMSRRDIIQALMQTKNETYLRFQSINLQGADLSRLDLSWINFKYANLSGANLNGSNISYSCFERADLSKSNLENAKCFGVRMTCVNLESASLTNADFEDPSGANRHAVLEGKFLSFSLIDGKKCLKI